MAKCEKERLVRGRFVQCERKAVYVCDTGIRTIRTCATDIIRGSKKRKI